MFFEQEPISTLLQCQCVFRPALNAAVDRDRPLFSGLTDLTES